MPDHVRPVHHIMLENQSSLSYLTPIPVVATEYVGVCAIDKNAEKLEQNVKDNREAVTQAQDHGQFENNGTMLPVKSVPETRKSVRNGIKWKKRLCPRRVKKLLQDYASNCYHENIDTTRTGICSDMLIVL